MNKWRVLTSQKFPLLGTLPEEAVVQALSLQLSPSHWLLTPSQDWGGPNMVDLREVVAVLLPLVPRMRGWSGRERLPICSQNLGVLNLGKHEESFLTASLPCYRPEQEGSGAVR